MTREHFDPPPPETYIVGGKLPGVVHGSANAVIAGCTCRECTARRKRMIRRGWRR